MTKNHRCLVALVSALVGLTALIHCTPANAQDTAVTGTVASSTKNTLTISTGFGQYQLYTFTPTVVKPATLPLGTQVQVVSSPGNEPDVRIAREITVVPAGAPAPPPKDNVPAEVHRLEREIERELRRFQVAAIGGVALDPELVMIGTNFQIGPLWRSGLYFRPGVELGIGEVTTMFGFNGEMIYRLPITSVSDRFSTYLGAGIGVNLLNQSFTGEEDGSRFTFGDFKSDTALNLLAGVRRRSGVFLELRTSIYSRPSPTLRLMVGYTF